MAIFNSFLYVYQRVVFSLVTSCFVRSIPRSRSERDHTMTSPFFVSDGSLHAARVSPYNIYICIYIYIYILIMYIHILIIFFHIIHILESIWANKLFPSTASWHASPLWGVFGIPKGQGYGVSSPQHHWTIVPTIWTYCGWKKSCTTLDGWNPSNNGINHISTGAGFLPSTVCSLITYNHVHASSFLGNQQILSFRWLNNVIIMW